MSALCSFVTLLTIMMTCVPAHTQIPRAEWHKLQVVHRTPLLVITFITDQGRVRVTLPEQIIGGEQFYGTIELPPEGASSAPRRYFLKFAEQIVRSTEPGFSWHAPHVNSRTDLPLMLLDFDGKQLGRAEVLVDPPRDGDDNDGTFYFPRVVQSGHAMAISGRFSGSGKDVNLTLNGVVAPILAQTSHRSIFLVPADLLGVVSYKLNGTTSSSGSVRCVVLEERLEKRSLNNAERTPYRLTVRGLGGLDHEVAIAISILTPTLAMFEPARITPKKISQALETIYFVHADETIFIQPSWVRKDGTFIVDRTLSGTQPGRIEIDELVVIPTTLEDEAALLLLMPRRHWTGTDQQERVELLRQRYGSASMKLLENLLRENRLPEKVSAAMLQLDDQAAAPAIFDAIARHPSSRFDYVLDWYTAKLKKDAQFRYRNQLHEAARELFSAAPSRSNTTTLAETGSSADIPLLKDALADPNLHPANRNLIVAALAHFGSQPEIDEITSKLRVVITREHAEDLRTFSEGARQAAFARDPRYIPLLCRHLDDPYWDYGDYSVAPGSDAAVAINAIEGKTLSTDQLKAFCKTSQSH